MNQDVARRRAEQVFAGTKYLSLATVDDDGPWCSNINYVRDPARPFSSLLFYSARQSRHARALDSLDQIAATIYILDAPDSGIDGCQLEGRCAPIPDHEVVSAHSTYYELNFPDPDERAEWMLPIGSFTQGQSHAFYRISVSKLWLIDDSQWEADKVDRRSDISFLLGG